MILKQLAATKTFHQMSGLHKKLTDALGSRDKAAKALRVFYDYLSANNLFGSQVRDQCAFDSIWAIKEEVKAEIREKNVVRRASKEKLPLMVNGLVYESSKDLLKRRLS